MNQPDNAAPNFEKAFARLEEILQTMNSGTVSLDDSLKLYEEADRLVKHCGSLLSNAEQKIETLMKTRDGNVAVGADGVPQIQQVS